MKRHVMLTSKRQMMETKSNVISDTGWDPAFWFAVFSPLFGILAGWLVPVLIYH